MTTMLLALKVIAVFVAALLPLRRQRRETKSHVEIGDWIVNEKGRLEDTAGQHVAGHPIKIRH